MEYGFVKETAMDFQEAVASVKDGLSSNGFSILWEIDVTSKVKEKVGKNFMNYLILGACNAPIAYEVISNDINAGLLLPCNVVIYESEGSVKIGYLKPQSILGLTRNQEIAGIATKAGSILSDIFSHID